MSDVSAADLRVYQISNPARPLRVWPFVVLLAIYWLFRATLWFVEIPISTNFLSSAAAVALTTLLFLVLWLANGTLSFRERLVGLALFLAYTTLAVFLTLDTLTPIGALFSGLPFVFTAWTLWLLVARRQAPRTRLLGLAAAMVAVWTPLLLVRTDGIDGDLNSKYSWRWTRSAEDDFLDNRPAVDASAPGIAADSLVVRPGDWTQLRGPNRDGTLTGVGLDTNWSANPPKQLWRKRVGPAWSSFVAIGDWLFTHEQRGPKEATIALEAATGREVWSHEDDARFWDGQAGAGPRATPTFLAGKLYTMGSTGVLNCLDAATGKPIWTRDVKLDAAAPLPMWGFSSSPLVVEDRVIVYGGGPDLKGMVAYSALDGEPLWGVATGPVSYSSPQLVEIGGQSQVLLLSDAGVVAVEPREGKVLWRHDAPGAGVWRAAQPRQVDATDVLIGSEDLGLVRLNIAQQDGAWQASPRYATKMMKPAYNDFVVLDNFAYGFDGSIFCCVDVETGKRQWKAGRYGHGQVLLLADQKLLVVLTEIEGDVVLVSAKPEKHEELGRISALSKKTWNHPVIAHGRLFVRNDEEMACYELPVTEKPAAEGTATRGE